MDLVDRLIVVQGTDPEDARRRKILNILLLGAGIAAFLGLFYTVFLDVTNLNPEVKLAPIYFGVSIVVIGVLALLVVNHFWSGQIASILFVLLLIFSITFGDEPAQVVGGRSLFMFVIPILIAGIVIRPSASFWAAALVSIIINLLIANAPDLISFNFISPLGLFLIALIAWLGARSLELVLADLQRSNQELEKRSFELEEANILLHQENTERRRAELELAAQARVLSRTNAELQQFAYVATHDLREPLRKVRSYAELLEQRYQGQLDEKADKYIHYVVSGATRMQVLITDLLAYLAVDNKEMSLKPTDLDMVLARVLADIDMLVQENTAVITHDPLPCLKADPSQMRTLLQNLLSNAIKFRGEASPHIHVAVEPQGDQWLFSIADNGIGIDPQYAERIFVIFQRLHTQEVYPGTGIGLAICKKVVQNHNGRIWLTSSLGQGATFYFTLPI